MNMLVFFILTLKGTAFFSLVPPPDGCPDYDLPALFVFQTLIKLSLIFLPKLLLSSLICKDKTPKGNLIHQWTGRLRLGKISRNHLSRRKTFSIFNGGQEISGLFYGW